MSSQLAILSGFRLKKLYLNEADYINACKLKHHITYDTFESKFKLLLYSRFKKNYSCGGVNHNLKTKHIILLVVIKRPTRYAHAQKGLPSENCVRLLHKDKPC